MAQVPYRPFVDAQPVTGGERLNVSAPPEDFGANVGRAIEHLGATGQQVAREMTDRAVALQDLKNETDAREQSIGATQQMAEENEEFKKLGQAAGDPGALRAHLDKLEGIRQQFRGNLTNPIAQRYYDAEAASLQNRFTVIGSEIAGSAFKTRVIGTAEAQMDLETKGFADPHDEAEIAKRIGNIKRLTGDTVGPSMGWASGGAQEQDYEFKRISKLRFGQATQLAQVDSQAALDLLARPDVKKQMTDDEYNHALDMANSHHIPVQSQAVITKTYDPTKTLKENEDAAAAEVPKHADAPDQQRRLETAVRAGVKTEYWYQKQAEMQQQREGENTVYDAISSGKFRTVQQMMAVPAVAEAIQKSTPAFRENLEGKLALFWGHRDSQTHEANFRRLLGKAIADPQGFLAEDLWSQDNVTSDGQLGRLLSARKEILKSTGPYGDPHVLQASEYIRRAFPNSVPPADKNNTRYQTWLGTLQGTIETIELTQRHKLGPEDWQKIGKSLIQDVPGSGYVTDYKVFENPVPRDILEDGRQKGQSDDETTYKYHRALAIDQMNKLFPGSTIAPEK